LRTALYQALGAFPKFVPVESFSAGLLDLLRGTPQLPIHEMRSLCENALFPLVKSFPPLLAPVADVVTAFLKLQNAKERTTAEDVVDSKQMFFFMKDLLRVATEATLGPVVELRQRPSGISPDAVIPPHLQEALVSLVEAVVDSGFDPRGSAAAALAVIDYLESSKGCDAYIDRLFGRLCIACATQQRLSERDRSVVGGQLADIYIMKFPRYSQSLIVAGVPMASVEKLHAVLQAAPRIDIKRKKFVECLVQLGVG
jgi:hypothetical protein